MVKTYCTTCFALRPQQGDGEVSVSLRVLPLAWTDFPKQLPERLLDTVRRTHVTYVELDSELHQTTAPALH